MKKGSARPPRLASAILEKIIESGICYGAMGDFEEQFHETVGEYGLFKARLTYWLQIMVVFPGFFKNSICWSVVMFSGYLKIALRNIKRNRGYSFINISGLSMGIACAVFILMWVQDELIYDRFHEKADRIYRVASRGRIGNTEISQTYTPAPMQEAMKTDFPEIEQSVRLVGQVNAVFEYEGITFNEHDIILADSTFFDVFSFAFVKGDPKTALIKPGTVVITEAAALKYFGDEDPLDKVMIIDQKYEGRVSGVVENVPSNSHFHFDFIVSMTTIDLSTDWMNNSFYTYIVLPEVFPPEQLEKKFPDFITKHIGRGNPNWQGEGNSWEYFLQPLTKIHLYSHLSRELEPNGDAVYVFIFTAIAIFILLIACVNFMNLTTARSANRAIEVGMRKVVGSSRSRLICQFLGETVTISFIALVFTLILIGTQLSLFNNLVGKRLELSLFGNPKMIFSLIGLTLLTGLVSGSYPAFFLSAFRPVAVISGRLRIGMRNKWMRNVLVIFQFAISIVLIIGTFIVGSQLNFIQNRRLGFTKDRVIIVKNLNPPSHPRDSFKDALLKHASISSVAGSHTLPGRSFDNEYFKPEDQSGITLNLCMCDEKFIGAMELEMAEGRFFSREFTTDGSAIIINETTSELLNWDNPIGKTFRGLGYTFHVIGVVKDFHYESFHHTIRPMALLNLRSPLAWEEGYISVRVTSANISEVLEFVEKTWRSFVPGVPFEYSFLDQDYETLYRNEQRTGKMFVIFSILAVFIASLGLFGLTSFTVEQRSKEVGIRKVCGASVSGITVLLSREFVKWVVVANVIAWPIAYFTMDRWLQNFAYRTDIKLWPFLLSGFLALLIAFISGSTQSIKAARTNPVESLRYE